MELFTTESTVVRPWREDEADRLLAIQSRMEVIRWLDDDPVPLATPEEARAKIASYHRRSEPCGPIGFWAIEERATGVVAGTVLLTGLGEEASDPSLDDDLEIGWHLHPDAWGRGLARQAAAGLLGAAFAVGVGRVHALMYVDNGASARVCVAIGMREQDRVVDQWYPGESRHFLLTAEEHAARTPSSRR